MTSIQWNAAIPTKFIPNPRDQQTKIFDKLMRLIQRTTPTCPLDYFGVTIVENLRLQMIKQHQVLYFVAVVYVYL
jgi:hypothetical protein